MSNSTVATVIADDFDVSYKKEEDLFKQASLNNDDRTGRVFFSSR
jgi:hypothetical protein